MKSKFKKQKPLVVTPWYSQDEWLSARDLVQTRDHGALSYFEVWRTRVAKLPAGVETTASLMEALLTEPHTALSLATAVNRFLNHVSHIGMNMWSVTKLHEAAEMLMVPEWIVQLRHETTHGHMPGVTMLRAALEFALGWLDVHYWNYSDGSEPSDESQDEYSELHRLLECYMYLKLYQVWGTERMTELQDQGDVWSHISDLWLTVKQSSEIFLEDLSVKQAVGVVKTEICSFVDREEGGMGILADLLVNEDLLVPDSDFLESLDTAEDITEDEVEVPDHLITIWSEFINIIDRHSGVKILVDRLMHVVQDCDTSNPEMAAAWVVTLLQGILGHGGHPSLVIKKDTLDKLSLEKWLESPNSLTSQMCGLLCQVTGVSDPRVETLVSMYTGGRLDVNKIPSINKTYTNRDLNAPDDSEKETESPDDNLTSWTLATDHCWESVPFGAVLGNKNWSSLWVNEKWIAPEEIDEGDDYCEENIVPTFEISQIDWSTATRGQRVEPLDKVNPAIPHFYSNSQYSDKLDQDLFRRRKRLKKN